MTDPNPKKPLFADEWMNVPLHSGHVLDLLKALNGPDYLIREMQVLSNSTINELTGTVNPIDALTDQFNEWVTINQGKQFGWLVLPSPGSLYSVFHEGLDVACGDKVTQPLIFGRKAAAIKYAQSLPVEYPTVVCTRVDGLPVQENGDCICFDSNIMSIKLAANRFETDVQILRA